MTATEINQVELLPVGRPYVNDQPPTELVARPRQAEETIMNIGTNIAASLAQARDHCATVEKDARNTFQRFNYASADAIIGAAKDAMHETGLIVMPLPAELHVSGSGTLAFYEMRRRVVLAHSSGEAIELPPLHWPVIPDKGRPLDKAFAIAITTSLAYFLRDLLSMQRVDATDDMTARNDPPQQQATNGSPATAVPTEPPDGPRVTAAQLLRIQLLIGQLGYDLAAVHSRLAASYRVSELDHLSPAQADEVEQKLEAAFNKKQQTVTT